MAKIDILVGLQWGDEGKGKFIDRMCPNYDIVARYNGGANAGHTIYWNNKKVTLKLLPSGIFYSHIINVIGSAVVIDPTQLRQEIEQLAAVSPEISFESQLIISQKAHLVLPTYKYHDIYAENSGAFRKIGTTKNGIGYAYSAKTLRQGFRVADIFVPDFAEEAATVMRREYLQLEALGQKMIGFDELLTTFLNDVAYLKQYTIADTELLINAALKGNKRILAEGAQATMLDIDHGTYPYVTSSNTIAAAACVGLGVPPQKVGEIYGVIKAYNTRVGEGPFPSEINDHIAETIRIRGNEFGSNTKRPRRIGWLDLPALKYAIMLNGVTQLIMTKSDVLNGMESIDLCTHYQLDGGLQEIYPSGQGLGKATPCWKSFPGWDIDFSAITSKEQLPYELKSYIEYLEAELEIPLAYLSISPKRDDIIEMR